LAVWGLDAAEYDYLELARLQFAYFRRKKYEAELIAASIGEVLAIMLGGKEPGGVGPGGRYQEVSADVALARAGIKFA
jgi:hypothetical protein